MIAQSLQAPFQLKINLLSEALSVDKNDLKFSWADSDKEPNRFQSAYQLVFAKSIDDLSVSSYIFDSGWIYSRQNASVTVDGLADALEDNQLYYWSVRIKNNVGQVSPFAIPIPFSTEIGTGWVDKTAVWAPPEKNPAHLGNFIFFRSPVFDLNRDQIEKVIISACARDTNPLIQQTFDLFINGQAAGYGPGRPHPNIRGSRINTHLFYNSYDVTDLIQDGKNVIAALSTGTIFLKDGYNIIGDMSGKAKRKAMFLAQATVFFKNHTKKILTHTGDGGWKTLDGSAAFGDTGRSVGTQYFAMEAEDIDAHVYPEGWSNSIFDDSDWLPAVPVQNIHDPEKEAFLPFPSENTLRVLTHEPEKTIMKLDNGDWFIDLGKEIIGGLCISLESPRDQKVDIFAGEQLNDDGTVRYHMACEPVYHDTWSLRKGTQHFHTFTMKCFRYVQIHGFNGIINKQSISGWALQQPFDTSQSSFSSSSDLLNKEYSLSKYTIQATNQDIYVDSQARERRPYEGDLLVNGNTSYSVSDQYSLARYSTNYLLDNETWPDDYKLFNVEFAWQDYLYTGDPQLLKSRYPILKKKLLLGENGTDNFDEKIGLVSGIGLIDWPKNERDGYVEGKYNTPFNATYFGIYTIMSKIASVAGNHADQLFYQNRAKAVQESLLSSLFDPKTQTFFDSMNADGTVNRHRALHSSACALAYNVVTPEDIDPRLTSFVGNDGTFKGSVYFAYFILRGLINGEAGDLAIRLLLNPDTAKDAKTFASILENLKATIAPEAWSNTHKPNLTLSHPWGATPGCMIVQGLFGILPTAPGFDSFQIKLQPGSVSSAEVTAPSIKGPIHAAYEHADSDRLTLEIDIPMNSRATVSLPLADYSPHDRISVNGEIRSAVRNRSFLTIELPSGHYVLKAAD